MRRRELTRNTNGASLARDLGARIRALRIEAGLSQEALADLCKLDRTYVGGIERGQRNPSLRNIQRIAVALDVSIANLFDEVSPIARSRPR